MKLILIKDLIGKKYGRLTIVGEAAKTGSRRRVLCLCDCGKEKSIALNNLTSGHTSSCGCFGLENITKHGLCYHPLYGIWIHLHSRCYNKNNKRYKDYGGRGIKVCKRWHVFETFYSDMIGGYKKGLTIDRKNVNGNYLKSNCKWSTPKEQANNKRNNRWLTANGLKLTVSQWTEKMGYTENLIPTRLKRGWPVLDAIFGRNEK